MLLGGLLSLSLIGLLIQISSLEHSAFMMLVFEMNGAHDSTWEVGGRLGDIQCIWRILNAHGRCFGQAMSQEKK